MDLVLAEKEGKSKANYLVSRFRILFFLDHGDRGSDTKACFTTNHLVNYYLFLDFIRI